MILISFEWMVVTEVENRLRRNHLVVCAKTVQDGCALGMGYKPYARASSAL
jgi:hypothetical protein